MRCFLAPSGWNLKSCCLLPIDQAQPAGQMYSSFSAIEFDDGTCRSKKVKPTRKCLATACFRIASRRQLHWFQKEVWLHRSLWENDPTYHLIYYLSKQFSNEFICQSQVWSLLRNSMFILYIIIVITLYALGQAYLTTLLEGLDL